MISYERMALLNLFGLKFGLRNLKTGISVFICILLSFLLQRETYVVSTITAVFTLREDHGTISNTAGIGLLEIPLAH